MRRRFFLKTTAIRSLQIAGMYVLDIFSLPCVSRSEDITRSSLLPLKISENGRFLVTTSGQPFFWLGDTAWRISILTPNEVDTYMENRVRHAFNVIQVHPGFGHPDYAGNIPFFYGDPNQPNEAFWSHIDDILDKARAYGLYVALVPMWGREYDAAFKGDAEKARAFGQWIGSRYAGHDHVVWIVSGEYDSINDFRLPISAEQKAVINAAAEGIRNGHGGIQLMTIHPGAVRTSSLDFHGESWLDFNMLQSGHMIDCNAYGQAENYALIEHDYRLIPTKPVLDGEPIYEDTPDGVWVVKNTDRPRADAAAVRRKAYWAVFSGACGHTYGHNDVYPFCDPAHPERSSPLPQGPGRHDWRTAIDADGATQMKYLRFLIESSPFLDRIPDSSLLSDAPRKGIEHISAIRDSNGTYALIYFPCNKPASVNFSLLAGKRIAAKWYDPTNGEFRLIEGSPFAKTGKREFIPPPDNAAGDGDWVLVLDSYE